MHVLVRIVILLLLVGGRAGYRRRGYAGLWPTALLLVLLLGLWLTGNLTLHR